VVKGPEKLQLSAIDAVKRWTFKPYLVDGAPVEVETVMTVNFALADAAAGRGEAPAAGPGAIGGVVADQTGAVIVNATVTAIDTDTGVRSMRQTDSLGRYSIAPLPPGNYLVEGVARGFQRTLQEGVQVGHAETVDVNLKLSVGAVSETLFVNGAGDGR